MAGLTSALVRLYPRTWRDRYGEEMLAMLRSQGLTPRTVTDLIAGAIDARLNPQAQPELSGDKRGAGKMLNAFTCSGEGMSRKDCFRRR